MTKSTLSDSRKKRIGRPPVGAILIGVRVPPAGVAELDGWIQKHAPDLSRPEAIRRLVEIGLKAKPISSERVRRGGRSLDLGKMAKIEPAAKAARSSRAAELAAAAIDKMADPAAQPEERDERRRRLTKGPPEFREVRVDRAKLKTK
jgi:hypothetical protein